MTPQRPQDGRAACHSGATGNWFVFSLQCWNLCGYVNLMAKSALSMDMLQGVWFLGHIKGQHTLSCLWQIALLPFAQVGWRWGIWSCGHSDVTLCPTNNPFILWELESKSTGVLMREQRNPKHLPLWRLYILSCGYVVLWCWMLCCGVVWCDVMWCGHLYMYSNITEGPSDPLKRQVIWICDFTVIQGVRDLF